MITDAQCADLCAAIYNPDRSKWDYVDEGLDDGVCFGLIHTNAGDVVVFRGSKTFKDWVRDLIALAVPWSHFRLGPVHPGFLLGMEQVWAELKPKLTMSGGPPIIAGHSLGGGRANILAGLMTLDGYQVGKLVTFGSPKPAFSQLAKIVSGIPMARVRNIGGYHHDLVTDLPFSFPPEEYLHTSARTDVSAQPDPHDDWGIFAFHHMELYQEALRPPAPLTEGKP